MLNHLLRGRIAKFSLDALMALAARASLAVHLEIIGRIARRTGIANWQA
jgi:predicted XRE-type DNA-binding protein